MNANAINQPSISIQKNPQQTLANSMQTNRYHSGEYLLQNPGWHEQDAGFKAEWAAQMLRKHPSAHTSVCDVGCGTGAVLRHLARYIPDIGACIGYDISETAIGLARAACTKGMEFHQADIARMPAPHQPYDLVLVMDVLEHLPDYFGFLEALAPYGKRYVMHIPLDMCVWSLMREGILIASKQRVGHLHAFTEDFILSILADHGYYVLDHFYTPPLTQAVGIKQKIVVAARKFLYALSPKLCTKTIGGYSILVLAERK